VGIEYTLRLASFNSAAVQLELARLAGVANSGARGEVVEFRRNPAPESSMPDAVAEVGGDSVYFRDNGGFGRDFLGSVVARLASIFGPITVEEL